MFGLAFLFSLTLNTSDNHIFPVSIVIPIYNEAENIRNVIEELLREAEKIFVAYEVVIIDDGSTDDSPGILEELILENRKVSFYRLSKNQGQSAATFYGIQKAQFERVLIMDGDGQYDPKDMLHLSEKLIGGVRLVSGKRDNRKDSFLYRSFSFIGNRFIAWLFSMETFDLGCGMKVAYKSDLLSLPVFRHIHRYLQIIYFQNNLTIAQVDINHRERGKGESKYSILKVFNILPRLLVLRLNKVKMASK